MGWFLSGLSDDLLQARPRLHARHRADRRRLADDQAARLKVSASPSRGGLAFVRGVLGGSTSRVTFASAPPRWSSSSSEALAPARPWCCRVEGAAAAARCSARSALDVVGASSRSPAPSFQRAAGTISRIVGRSPGDRVVSFADTSVCRARSTAARLTVDPTARYRARFRQLRGGLLRGFPISRAPRGRRRGVGRSRSSSPESSPRSQ